MFGRSALNLPLGLLIGTPSSAHSGGSSHNRRSMALSLSKFPAFNPLTTKSVTVLRPVTCCVMTTNTTTLECNVKLDEDGGCTSPEVSDAFNKDVCPRLAATSNLAHLLNSMDIRIRFRKAFHGCPRWDVFEDAEALYIVRDLSGLPKSLHVEKFFEYSMAHIMAVTKFAPVNVFGCVRVRRMKQAIELTVGREGPDPGISINGVYYQGYSATIDLPATSYSTSDRDVAMDVNNEVLKIYIAKQGGKWVQNFNLRLVYHTFTGCWQREDIDD